MQVTTGVQPYDPFAPYAPVLDDCVYLGQRDEDDPCTLLRLPVLGLESSVPTVDDVMGRVLVSNTWMGTRFREVLESFPPEFLLLFRPITAVVISGDVRPSFYWATPAAIYLDPNFLWLTDEERGTVTRRPDFRADFDKDLSFKIPRRYLLGRAPAFRSRPRPGAIRSFTEVRLAMARLLAHELAHANDYLPLRRLVTLSPYRNFRPLTPEAQVELLSLLPLRSSVLFGLAFVAFEGAPATTGQRAYTPDFVASEFAGDRANDFYSYSDPAEDVAMLFEEMLLLSRFGVDKDVAVTPRPKVPNPTASDYIVVWGQRNRIGDIQVRERVRLVARRILPELPVDAIVDALPPPLQLVPGRSLVDNLALAASGRILPLDPDERRAAEEAEIETITDCATAWLNGSPPDLPP